MSNTLVAHQRLFAAGVGAVVALPSSGIIVAASLMRFGSELAVVALIAPLTGAALGLLLGAGVRPSPSAYPGFRAVAAGLLAVPVGSLITAVVVLVPSWTSHPLTALFQTALYGLAGVMVYGWLVVPLTLPSAVVGAFFLQWLLARLGATGELPVRDLREPAS